MSVCPVWGDPHPATITNSASRGWYFVVDSPRAGGRYKLSNRAKNSISGLDDAQKARLTTLLVEERIRGNPCPEINTAAIDDAVNRPPLSVYERAERMLFHLAKDSKAIGDRIPIHEFADTVYAWSESVDLDEVLYLLNYLKENQWVNLDGGGGEFSRKLPNGKTHIVLSETAIVTVTGYSRLSNQAVKTSSSQVFVAMWFDSSMDDAFGSGIKPGITDAGYDPLRIDQKPNVNKIDDEIIAEIRRSRFLVADFTYGDNGARGGVYYEAGFAHGLGLPVIFSCRNDIIDNLHFDARQYHHIVWETPDELRESLRNRILALIGEGPGIEPTVT